jgi:pantoate--beta-alanine ligase
MDAFDTIDALRAHLGSARATGRRIGFVPTMGYLHRGHLALVDAARAHSDVVVLSIFVNPLQFGPGEDFERYPRDAVRDREMARGAGVDVLFAPSVDEMYRAGRHTRVTIPDLAARWEGAIRPGHFDGVLTVVAKLFHIVAPDVACFGQKDIQQVVLVQRMIAELDFPVALCVVPTVRDADGLALSSRNSYLDADARLRALTLSRGLRHAHAAWRDGERHAGRLHDIVAGELAMLQLEPDYIAVVDPQTLAPVTRADAGTIIAIAVRVGATRLIDNLILGEEVA